MPADLEGPWEAVERLEAEVCRSLVAAAPPAVARRLGLALRTAGTGVAMTAPAVDVLAHNRALGMGIGAPARPEEVDDLLDFFREAGAKRCMVNVCPAARSGLEPLLAERGFRLHNHWLKLWRDARQPTGEPDPRVRPMEREHAEIFARCEVQGFDLPDLMVPWLAATLGRPHWHHFTAFDDGVPAGFAALYAPGRDAWLGMASTLAEHRRKGLQSALIATRLRLAADLGCERIAVETADDTPEKPNPSTHNLVRLGFRVLYRRPNWVKKLEVPES